MDVDSGSILLGGVDIRALPLQECTSRIAYVSQDNYLFDLSVMDNIRMGRRSYRRAGHRRGEENAVAMNLS